MVSNELGGGGEEVPELGGVVGGGVAVHPTTTNKNQALRMQALYPTARGSVIRLARFELVTLIRAPRERCFDLSRDIDLHVRSMVDSNERAIAGKTSGLIGLGEEVTWEARHFGVLHTHRSRITEYDRPRHFRDIQIEGRFARFEHDHFFTELPDGTEMRDVLEFDSPLGALGKLVDWLILGRYLQRLIRERNELIRAAAEAE